MENQNFTINNNSQDNISLSSSVSNTLNRNISATVLLQYLMQEVRNHTELSGDTEQNKRRPDIECECRQPSEGGAAVPLIAGQTLNEENIKSKDVNNNENLERENDSNSEASEKSNLQDELREDICEWNNLESPIISCTIKAKSNLNSNNLGEDPIALKKMEQLKLNDVTPNKNSYIIRRNVSKDKINLNAKTNLNSEKKTSFKQETALTIKHDPFTTATKELRSQNSHIQKQYSNISNNEQKVLGTIKRAPKSLNSYVYQNQKCPVNNGIVPSFKKVASSTALKNNTHIKSYLENDLILKVFDQISDMKNKTDELLQLEKRVKVNNFRTKSKEIWDMFNVVNNLEKTTNCIKQNDVKSLLKLVTPKASKTALINVEKTTRHKRSLKDFEVTLLHKKCSTICNKIDKICSTLSTVKNVLNYLTGPDELNQVKSEKESLKIKEEILKNKASEKVVKVITPEVVSPETSTNKIAEGETESAELIDNKLEKTKIKLVEIDNEQAKSLDIDRNSSTKTIDSMCNIYITSSRSLNSDDEDLTISEDSIIFNLNCKDNFDQDSLKSHTLSDTSTNSLMKVKRCPKDFSLCMEIIHHKLMFQTGEGPMKDELISGCNECTNKKSEIIQIKSSTECCYVSQIFPVDRISLKALKSANSEIFNVVNFVVPVKHSSQFRIKSLDDMIATVEKKFSSSSKSLPTFNLV